MIKIIPSERNDAKGLGHFGAPRGSRTHKGVDFAVAPGSAVLSPVSGLITKLGYPYANDLSWRYVEVTQEACVESNEWGLGSCPSCGKAHPRHRLFYVEPSVRMTDRVEVDDKIGYLQDISIRYPGMTPHVHYEVKCNDEHVDPSRFSNLES